MNSGKKKNGNFAPYPTKNIDCKTCGRVTKHSHTRSYEAPSDGRLMWEGWCHECLNFNEIQVGRAKPKYPLAPIPWLDGRPTA